MKRIMDFCLQPLTINGSSMTGNFHPVDKKSTGGSRFSGGFALSLQKPNVMKGRKGMKGVDEHPQPIVEAAMRGAALQRLPYIYHDASSSHGSNYPGSLAVSAYHHPSSTSDSIWDTPLMAAVEQFSRTQNSPYAVDTLSGTAPLGLPNMFAGGGAKDGDDINANTFFRPLDTGWHWQKVMSENVPYYVKVDNNQGLPIEVTDDTHEFKVYSSKDNDDSWQWAATTMPAFENLVVTGDASKYKRKMDALQSYKQDVFTQTDNTKVDKGAYTPTTDTGVRLQAVDDALHHTYGQEQLPAATQEQRNYYDAMKHIPAKDIDKWFAAMMAAYAGAGGAAEFIPAGAGIIPEEFSFSSAFTPGGTFWMNPATKTMMAGTLGGAAVDGLTHTLTGHSWGENMGGLVERSTGWNPNDTWLGRMVMDMTNPGWLTPYGLVERVATKAGQYAGRAYNAGKTLIHDYRYPSGMAEVPEGFGYEPSMEASTAVTTITPENAATITDAQWDAAYNAAVGRGDMVEAQRLRDLHFMAKASQTKVSVGGKPITAYHGQTSSNELVRQRGLNPYSDYRDGRGQSGFFSSSSKGVARTYTKDNPVSELYINMENPYITDAEGRTWRAVEIHDHNGYRHGITTNQIAGRAKNEGYDGVIIKNVEDVGLYRPNLNGGTEVADDYITFGGRAKLRDAITRDDAGSIIPLSQRDNFDVGDVRYSIKDWFNSPPKETSISVPELTEDYIKESLLQADNYKHSKEYQQLVERAMQESEDLGIGYFPEEVFIGRRHENPTITYSKRNPGKLGKYDKRTNTIDMDLEQATGTDTPYHEGLHWQRVGESDMPIGPAYGRWRDAIFSGKSVSESQPLWDEILASPMESMRMEWDTAAENYLRYKTKRVLDPSTPFECPLNNPHELHAYTQEAGHALGIEPFAPYPGQEKAKEAIERAINYDSTLKHIKHSSEEETKDFWDLLTGNYIPITIGSSIVVGSSFDN